jgi:2'-5' RNA ligase
VALKARGFPCPRLFTGIEIPAELREELAPARTVTRRQWIEPENLHLTLRFVGDLDNIQATEFADRLGTIDTDAFELRLAGLAPSPATSRARLGGR